MPDEKVNGKLVVTDKIGIGIEEPIAQLHIASSTPAPSQTFLESGGALLKLSVDASGAAIGTDNAFPLSIKTDDISRISVSQTGNVTISEVLSVQKSLTVSGNVGIGTTSPSYKLAIAAGDINIDDGRALRQAGRWVIGGDSNILSIGSSNAPDGRDIRFDPGFSGALTVKKDTGNVGIGTTAPSSKLDVRGNLFVQAEVRADGGFQVDGQTVIDADAGWHRSYGNTGWYNGTHGGGWYMEDSTWIRSYGGKNVYHNTGVLRTDGILQVGPDGNRFVVNTSGNIGMSSDRVFGHNPSDKFIYDGKEMGHYSLGWFSDRWDSGGPTAWLSGYSGVKLFSRGELRFSIDGVGNIGMSSDRVFGHSPRDKFIYDGKEMGHYSLGWFSDSWDSGGPTAWLSGYSGVKLFSRGELRFWVEGGGNVRYAVSLERSSSRKLKESIAALPAQEAIETLEGLNPVKYNLKADKEKNLHIGFIAEDVPDLVASRDRKAISTDDIVAVLTKVVKEQQNTISVLAAKIKALEEKQN